jgi:hypothetical protein
MKKGTLNLVAGATFYVSATITLIRGDSVAIVYSTLGLVSILIGVKKLWRYLMNELEKCRSS